MTVNVIILGVDCLSALVTVSLLATCLCHVLWCLSVEFLPYGSLFTNPFPHLCIFLNVQDCGEKFMYDEGKVVPSTNLMDRWIVSFTQSLLLFVKQVTSPGRPPVGDMR